AATTIFNGIKIDCSHNNLKNDESLYFFLSGNIPFNEKRLTPPRVGLSKSSSHSTITVGSMKKNGTNLSINCGLKSIARASDAGLSLMRIFIHSNPLLIVQSKCSDFFCIPKKNPFCISVYKSLKLPINAG